MSYLEFSCWPSAGSALLFAAYFKLSLILEWPRRKKSYVGEALAKIWLLNSVGETGYDSGVTRTTKKSYVGEPLAKFWLLTSVGKTDWWKKISMGEPLARGYIPKIFAFKNRYPLNPEESDLFYFLLIRTKRPISPKFQRAVSSSSELHAIQRIPRENITLSFLLIIRQNPRH